MLKSKTCGFQFQVAILSEAEDVLVESAYAIGRHLGMAFQLLDDVLDFVGEEAKLGKPAGGSDLQLGLATGPVLFAAQQVIFLFINFLRTKIEKLLCMKSPRNQKAIDMS